MSLLTGCGPHSGSNSAIMAAYLGSSSNLRFTTASVNWREQEQRGKQRDTVTEGGSEEGSSEPQSKREGVNREVVSHSYKARREKGGLTLKSAGTESCQQRVCAFFLVMSRQAVSAGTVPP